MDHKAWNGLSVLTTTIRCQKAYVERTGKNLYIIWLTAAGHRHLIHYQIPHLIRELYTPHVSEGHRLFHLSLAILSLSGVSLHNMPEIQVDPTGIPELKRETSTRRQTSQIKIIHSFLFSRIPALYFVPITALA